MPRALNYAALLASLCVTVKGQAPAPGTVRVTVLDENGKPIEGAIVDAQRTVYPSAQLRECWTDGAGACSLGGLGLDRAAAPGSQEPTVYRMSASKYYAGYRPLASNVSCEPQTQDVTGPEIHQGRNVTLRIGPQAGIIRMTVADAKTGKRLQGDIQFKWGGACPESFGTGVGIAGDDRLVAPNIPVEMVVSSPGFEPWEFRAKRAKPENTFVLRPKEVRTFHIRLHPKE